MDAKKVAFFGFLSNVDSSILKLKLGNGFRMKSMPEKAGMTFLCYMEGMTLGPMYERVRTSDPVLNVKEEKFYYVAKAFDARVKTSGTPTLESSVFDSTELVLAILKLTFMTKVMRLFKEGDVRLLFSYGVTVENNKPKKLVSGSATNTLTSHVPFTLTEQEKPELERFLKTVRLPFKKGFLKLAFDFFEASYDTRSLPLGFLSLIISLEVLLNDNEPVNGQYSNPVPEYCSALLGASDGERRKIKSDIINHYRRRTRLVHYGENNIRSENLLSLRQYVRASMIEALARDCDKPELLNQLKLNQG